MIEEAVQSAVAEMTENFVTTVTTVVLHSLKCSTSVAVAEAMEEYQHKCLLDLDEKEIEATQTFFDVVKATGHGNIVAGIEEIRENHNFIIGLRRRCEKAGEAVVQTVVKGVTSALLIVLVIGIIVFFSEKAANLANSLGNKIGG